MCDLYSITEKMLCTRFQGILTKLNYLTYSGLVSYKQGLNKTYHA